MPDPIIHCYRCGTSLAALTLPLARLDECPNCSVQVHVCRMCIYYDPAVPEQCREDDAEAVKEKERANFCDYFKPRDDAFTGTELAAEQQAKSQLSALFGDADGKDDTGKGGDPDLNAAEELFK